MAAGTEHRSDDSSSENISGYSVFEKLTYPVCILGINGILLFSNSTFKHYFTPSDKEIRLDWEHPFFPEYRKRIAQAYISAINGVEKECFAIINDTEGKHLPVEIYLFPMFENGAVISILALMKIVDSRLLSFDRSTLSLISEDNFQYDSLHFEFSPLPILRIDENFNIIKCSHACEGFFGCSSEEITDKKNIILKSIFPYDSEKVKKAITTIMKGELTFQRIGEAKLTIRETERKVVNLIMYPIIQNNQISAVETVIEDITSIKDLKDQINTMRRVQLLSDITKGFLHLLNNTMNVIMSKTQILLQITEKDVVTEGIQVIEDSINELVEQTRRVQDYLSIKNDLSEETVEPLVNIIEDAIEFSKMQFKVEDKEKRRRINIERKYFSSAHIKTDTRLLREIIISIILKVSNYIQKSGTLRIVLKSNHDLCLAVNTDKVEHQEPPAQDASVINIFSGVNIREVAEKINLKIIEEESVNSYSLKAIFPPRLILDKQVRDSIDFEYKLRDLDIIIVEDELSLQKILYDLFDKMGNRVFICDNGQVALDEFKKKRYDLLITDYGISGITGIELAAKIKELDENIPTVLLSGWMLDDVTAYRKVIDLFLPKPFKIQELLKSISKLMSDKGK